MKREELRTKTAGCKVTESEHAALEEAAARAGMTLSDWCRQALTTAARETAGTPAEEAVLAEVIALRTVLLNLMFSLAKGEAVTADGMQNLIGRADANKLERAGSGYKPHGTAREKVTRRQTPAPLSDRLRGDFGRR